MTRILLWEQRLIRHGFDLMAVDKVRTDHSTERHESRAPGGVVWEEHFPWRSPGRLRECHGM